MTEETQKELQALQPDTKEIVVEDGYRILFEPGEHMVLVVGAKAKTASSRFDHPAVIAKEPKTFNFRKYYASGAKRWFTSEGCVMYFVVPKDRIQVVLDKGYSYVEIKVGDADIRLNVSGGTSGRGWSDWVRTIAETSVGYPVKTLKALAAASLPAVDVPEDIRNLIEASVAQDRAA